MNKAKAVKNGTLLSAQQEVPPHVAFVTIMSDHTKSSEGNPNGIMLSTNLKVKSGSPEMIMIQLLSEAVHLLARGAQTKIPVSDSIVLPDGSPAPLFGNANEVVVNNINGQQEETKS